MAGTSVTKSVACPNCGRSIDKSKLQARNAGLFCDECAAGMRAQRVEKTERQCPACAKAIGENDVVCAQCGFDYRIGYSPKAISAQTTVGASKHSCSKCGYDCTNLPAAVRCPECGTGLSFSVSHERYAEVRAADPAWKRWMRQVVYPVAFTALAISLYIAFMMVTKQKDLLGLGMTKMGVRYVSLCIVTIASLILWMEVEMTLGEVLLKLLVVASFGFLAEQILWDSSNLLIAYPFVTMVVIALLAKNLELEITDASILAMINWPIVFLCLMAFPPELRFK